MSYIIRKVKSVFKTIYFTFFYKELFKDYRFTISKASTEVERRELYRLRYQVYCEEYGYIDRNNCPDGLEKDVYDEHSDYFIIRDSKNNIAATVRIIKNSQAGFPLEKNFHLNIETSNLDHDHLVEISRLIVARKYRKKLLLLFLVKGLYLYAIEQKITHAYFIIDEKLYPLLLKIKVPVIKIGTPAIYQGLTFPCLVDVTEWERNVRRSRSFNRFYYFGGMDLSDDGNKYEVH